MYDLVNSLACDTAGYFTRRFLEARRGNMLPAKGREGTGI